MKQPPRQSQDQPLDGHPASQNSTGTTGRPGTGLGVCQGPRGDTEGPKGPPATPSRAQALLLGLILTGAPWGAPTRQPPAPPCAHRNPSRSSSSAAALEAEVSVENVAERPQTAPDVLPWSSGSCPGPATEASTRVLQESHVRK